MRLLLVSLWALGLAARVGATDTGGPSHRYAAPLHVECMNRSSETGEHIQNERQEIQWIPFPTCAETDRPLEFHYGVEGSQNCTIPSVSDAFFHLLEFYIHSDAPLSCRLPARPRAQVDILNEPQPAQEYIPLVFALAGTLQLSHLHVSTRMNVLLHTTPKRRIRAHDTGVLDSGVAYSTSTLDESASVKLIIGDPLPLRFSVRWFPTPELPSTDGTVMWQGMGGHVYASTVVYVVLSFLAGAVVAGAWFYGKVLPERLRGRGLGGATPLGAGVGGNGVGNGWGYSKRID
ncbi:uncharacterized protein DNG_01449 [Cephalotrichum gorgonifer]|uniref:Uncharacterized protein n=1 Tax=Cephalotrichum gorgonifer TaxID=2041049 RepID=A0AAE8SRN8_9PEZI|nr:uncharacterized protein DNG_01449 [Cephalotrichum gorgonifer]